MYWLSTTHAHNFNQWFELRRSIWLNTLSFKMTTHQDLRYRSDSWIALILKCHCCQRRFRCLAGKVFLCKTKQKPLVTYLNLLQCYNFNSDFISSVLELLIKEIHENYSLQTWHLFFLTVLKQDLCLLRLVTDHYAYVTYRKYISEICLEGMRLVSDSLVAHTFKTN